jgi:hypothetical protein
MNKEVRRLKLELIMKDEPGLRKVINFLDQWFIGTVKEERDNMVIYWKESDFVFYYYKDRNEKNRLFWINRDKIWSFFISNFGYNYTDIQAIMLWYVERTQNLKGCNTNKNTFFFTWCVERTHNLKGCNTEMK